MVNILDNKVFIFDLDGVIIDSEKTHFKCYKEAISRYTEMKLDWNTYCEIHHSINKTFNDLFPKNYNDIYALKTELYKQSIKNISLISGFYEFFRLLIKYGKQICIVTDAPKDTFDMIASKYPFILKSNIIVTRNDTKYRKPNSECYLQVIKRYIDKVELNEIVAFEDSYKGWFAATNVIYNCVLVNTPDYFYYNEINALNHIDNFNNINTLNEPFEYIPFYISSKTKHRTRWLKMKEHFPIFANWIDIDIKKEDMTILDKSNLCETIKNDIPQCSFGILYTEEGEQNHIGSLIEIGMLISQSKPIYLCGDNIFKDEVLFNFKSLINCSYSNNFNLFQSFRNIQYDLNQDYNDFKKKIINQCKHTIIDDNVTNKIDYIVICASGKGTRLLPITKNIPKLLVNVNNDCILHNIINYWKQYSNKFTVIIDSEYNNLVKFYLNMINDITYEIINVDCRNKEENSYTLHNALSDNKYIHKKLLITWCDIFPNTTIPSDIFKDNNIIFTYKNFGRYDAYNNCIEKKTLGNIIGIYYFSNFTHLIHFEPHMDICDCYKENFGDFITYEIEDLTDIGDYTKLCKYEFNNKYKTRFFNTIHDLSNNILLKSSTCKYGDKIITDEMLFYKYHDELNNIPNIIKFNENSFSMKKINGLSAIDVFNKSHIPKQVAYLQNIIQNLEQIHKQTQYTVDDNILKIDIKQEFYQKVINRLNNITPLLDNFQFIKSVNSINIRFQYHHIIKDLYVMISDYFATNIPQYHTIHGDPHMSNILIDQNDNIYFIDPRGYFGNTKLFGVKEYDISKIIYSLSGFDEINNNNNHFFVVNNNNIDVNITNNMDNYLFLFKDYNIQILKCMTILHWFGLTDYSKNNIHKCVSSYFYGIYLYHKYYDDISLLRKKA